MLFIKDSRHWDTETYRQRMTIANWRKILLQNDEKLTFNGRVRELEAKSIGFGVVEVSKKPL